MHSKAQPLVPTSENMKMMLGQFSFVLSLVLTLAQHSQPAVNSKHQDQPHYDPYAMLSQKELPYSMSMDNVLSSDQYKFERMNSFPRKSDVNREAVDTDMARLYQDDGLVDPSLANGEYRGPAVGLPQSLQGDGLFLDQSLVSSQRDPQNMFDVGVGSDFRFPREFETGVGSDFRFPREFEVGAGSDFRLPGNDFMDQKLLLAPSRDVPRPYTTGFQPKTLYSDSKSALLGFSDDEGRALLNGNMLSPVSDSISLDGSFANVHRRGLARFPLQSLESSNLHAPLRRMNRLSPISFNRLPHSNGFRARNPLVYSPQRRFLKSPVSPRNRAILRPRNIAQLRRGTPVQRLQRHAARRIQIYPNPVRNIMGLSRSRLSNPYNLRSMQFPLSRTAATSYRLLPAKTSKVINKQPPYQEMSKLRLTPKRSTLTQPSRGVQYTNLF